MSCKIKLTKERKCLKASGCAHVMKFFVSSHTACPCLCVFFSLLSHVSYMLIKKQQKVS